MSKSSWLNEVAQALRRQRLPRSYIRRFTDELADHFDDSYHTQSQERIGMDADAYATRLGAPDEIASRAVFELRRRTYAGRHPFIMFVAAPLPTAVLLLVGLCVPLLLVFSAVPDDYAGQEHLPAWTEALVQAVVWTMQFAPFLAGALVFCHLAKRAVCGARWSFVACGLLALLAGCFMVSLSLPTSGPGSGTLMMGFRLPPAPVQYLQALAPIAVWFIYARRDLGRQSQLA